MINCLRCQFVFETIDLRKCEVFGSTECEFVYMDEPALLEPSRVLWREGCYNNKVTVGDLLGYFLYKVSWTVMSSCNAPNTVSRPRVYFKAKKEDEKKEEEAEAEEGSKEDEDLPQWITCFDELLNVRHVRLTEKVVEEGATRWQLTPEGAEEMKRLIPMVSPCLLGEEALDSCYEQFHRDFIAEHIARKKKDEEEAKARKKEEARKKKEEKAKKKADEKKKKEEEEKKKKEEEEEKKEDEEAKEKGEGQKKKPKKKKGDEQDKEVEEEGQEEKEKHKKRKKAKEEKDDKEMEKEKEKEDRKSVV